MVVLHDPVQHRIRYRSVPNPFMPVLYGQLAGDDRGLPARPVIDHLQQVRARLRIHAHQAPVIEYQHIRVLQDVQPARERAVCVPDSQLLGQARHPLVERTVPLPTGMLR
mgnify:CR=1 FL=1